MSAKRMLFVALLVIPLLAVGTAVQPAQAQGATWTAEFFDNPYFLGEPEIVTQSSVVGFNWGTGSPGQGFPADNFTARITTDVVLPGGTYRFNLRADDRVHMYVDFQSVIDAYDDPRVGETLTVELDLAPGSHHIQIDYREETGNAYVYLSYTNVATGEVFGVPSQTGVSGAWTAEYYANPNLAGEPAAIVGENAVNFDWGQGAPIGLLPSDNFSARWRSNQNLAGGTYRVSVRADDGVRVFVNGNLVIDEWHTATNLTYSRDLNLRAGTNDFTVEYYEAFGQAFIDFTLTRLDGGPAPQQPVSEQGVAATVTAGRLNVRDAPSVADGRVITVVSRGQRFNVVGRTTDGTWLQLNINGTTGWASSRWLNTSSGSVPVQTPDQPTDTAYTLVSNVNLNIRSAPNTDSDILNVLRRGDRAEIIARNTDASWFLINENGTEGWVSARFVTLGSGTDVSRIQVR